MKTFTEKQAAEWLDRHDLENVMRTKEAICAMEDAASLTPYGSGPASGSEVIAMLIAVARAAYFLADDAEEDGHGIITCDNQRFAELFAALDKLDALPEPGPHIIGTGPAKAEAILLPNNQAEP